MKTIIKICSVFLSVILSLQGFHMIALAVAQNKSLSENIYATISKKQISDEELNKIDSIKADERFNDDFSLITSEIVELRNENSKYFLHQDGTYTVAMYSKPIHFLQNGEWKDINASLKLNNNETDKYGKAMYTPEAMGLDISFPQDLKENQKISISKNNCEIELEVKKGDSDLKDVADKEMIKEKNKLESECIVNNAIADNSTSANVDVSLENNMIMIDNEEKMELDNLSSSIMYKSVLPNTDFEYIINSDKIKENIIINSPQTEYTYEFKVSLTGLSP